MAVWWPRDLCVGRHNGIHFKLKRDSPPSEPVASEMRKRQDDKWKALCICESKTDGPRRRGGEPCCHGRCVGLREEPGAQPRQGRPVGPRKPLVRVRVSCPPGCFWAQEHHWTKWVIFSSVVLPRCRIREDKRAVQYTVGNLPVVHSDSWGKSRLRGGRFLLFGFCSLQYWGWNPGALYHESTSLVPLFFFFWDRSC